MRLSLVIPCYNEEAVLPLLVPRVERLLEDLSARGIIDPASDVWLVDDGSRDATWKLIEAFTLDSSRIVGIKLSRNCGHQNALLAGLLSADGDAVISLDADLQDDTGVIEQMVDAWERGAEMVYGVRRSRPDDSFFKRWTAQRYYKLLQPCSASTSCPTMPTSGCWGERRCVHWRAIRKRISSCAASCRSSASAARRSITTAACVSQARRNTRCAACSTWPRTASLRSARRRFG